MKVFITGASGFIGKAFLAHLIEELQERDEIYLLMRSPAEVSDPRIRVIYADLAGIDTARRELLECDYVFHLAANATFGDNADYDEVNYEPTKVLVDILKDSSTLKCLVFTSTIGAVDRAEGDLCHAPLTVESTPSPRSRYGESKLKAEHYIKGSAVPYCIIRPTWVYGSNMRIASHISRFVSMVRDGHPIIRFTFPGQVSLIHVNDLADALVRCIDNQAIVGRVFFAETEAMSIGALFATISNKLLGSMPSQLPVPFCSSLMSRLHHKLPLAVANLFIDYLRAHDPDFLDCFGLADPIRFELGIEDVIATHPKVHGCWVITGANSGIGLALARTLDLTKVSLVLIDRETGNLDGFEGATVLKADLTNECDIASVCETIRRMRIRCLVNNAGIGVRGAFQTTGLEEIKRIVAINALAPVQLTRGLIDVLVAQESVIINIASSIAYNPLPYMSLYSSTKAFLSNWSESLTYELRRTNRVVTFSPSGTLTSFQQSAGVKVLNEGKGLLSPEYVAKRIIEAERYGNKVVILGWTTRALLMVSRFLPRSLNIMLWGKLFEQYR